MAKRDYVLEKALKGDLDALENILGGVLAPLFDLAFHLLGDEGAARNCLKVVLEATGTQILSGDLSGSTPFQIASRFAVGVLQEQPDCLAEWQEFLVDLEPTQRLVFLTNQSLGLEGGELDHLFAFGEGEADAMIASLLQESGLDREAWRTILDEHAMSASLPSGLMDEVLDRFEESD